MKRSGPWLGLIGVLALALALALPNGLQAGGSGFDDEHDHDAEKESLVFFGFVKDNRGAIVADAKVTVGVKGVGEVVTRSTVLGAYRVTGFRNDIDQSTIGVQCEKQGYKYVRSFRRSPSGNSPTTPIELECVMQRG